MTDYSSMIRDSDDFDPNSGGLFLLYGPSGAGKTWLAGTANDSFFVNLGNGLDTLNSPLFLKQYPHIKRKYIDILEKYDPHNTKATAFDITCDIIEYFWKTPALYENTKTFVIDDATSLRTVALNKAIEIQDEPRDTKRKLNRYVKTDMSDIGREMHMINWFLAEHLPQFKKAGIHFILTAHERQIYGKATKMGEDRPLKAIKPGFSGQTFPDEVPKHFDEVWHVTLKADKGTYRQEILTVPTGVVLCKTRRAGVFPRYIINKDMEELFQMRKENKLHPSFGK